MTGAVLVFRDVSDRRRTQRELAQARDEIEKTAAELKRSNDDLSQFAYIASHDLRSPLNTVTNLTELIARKYGDRLGEGNELRTCWRCNQAHGKAYRGSSCLCDRFYSKRTDRRNKLYANIQLESALENYRRRSRIPEQ